MNRFLLTLKLRALEAVASAEAYGRDVATREGRKLLGVEKRADAVRSVVDAYRHITKDVPGLNETDLDDKFVEKKAVELVDWAFERIGGLLNTVTRDAVSNAPNVPAGGVR